MQAILYGFAFAHHSGREPFHSLAAALGPDCRVVDVTHKWLPKWLPERVYRGLSYRWYRYSEYRLRSFYRSSEPTVFHYFFPENTLFKADEWKGRHRLVLTCHQPPDVLAKHKDHPGYAQFFLGLDAADMIVLQTESQVAPYQALLPNHPFEVIPLGVDAEYFSPGSAREASAECPRILSVGNWLRDYHAWARLVPRILAQRPDAQFRVLANPDTLQEARSALGGSEHDGVTFLTGLSDEELKDEYTQASLVYLPLSDAMANNALLEGMAMATPVVATDLPATREYLGTRAGLFVRNEDPNETAQTIMALLDDPVRIKAMGVAGRRRVEQSYSWPVVAKQYREVYARVRDGRIPRENEPPRHKDTKER